MNQGHIPAQRLELTRNTNAFMQDNKVLSANTQNHDQVGDQKMTKYCQNQHMKAENGAGIDFTNHLSMTLLKTLGGGLDHIDRIQSSESPSFMQTKKQVKTE